MGILLDSASSCSPSGHSLQDKALPSLCTREFYSPEMPPWLLCPCQGGSWPCSPHPLARTTQHRGGSLLPSPWRGCWVRSSTLWDTAERGSDKQCVLVSPLPSPWQTLLCLTQACYS